MSYSLSASAYLSLVDNAALSISTSGSPPTSSITWAIWVKPADETPAVQHYLLQFHNTTGSYNKGVGSCLKTGGTVCAYKGDVHSGGAFYYESAPSTTINTTDWWLVIGTIQPGAGSNEYRNLDGYVAKLGDTSFAAGAQQTTVVSYGGDALDCLIINQEETYNTSQPAAKYAEVAIWSTLLSQSDREALLTARPNTVQAASLKGYWPLESDLAAGSGSAATTALSSTGTVAADAGDHPYAGGASAVVKRLMTMGIGS